MTVFLLILAITKKIKMDPNKLPEYQFWATVILGGLTIYTYFRISGLSQKGNSFNRLDDELNNIVNTWVKYPYLEDEDFIIKYHKKEADRMEGLRYDAYCTLVFNFVESLHKHFKGNKTRMGKYNEYPEMILVHKSWWAANQLDPLTAYTGKFKDFVQFVINDYAKSK
jgi:hypothetical protein